MHCSRAQTHGIFCFCSSACERDLSQSQKMAHEATGQDRLSGPLTVWHARRMRCNLPHLFRVLSMLVKVSKPML